MSPNSSSLARAAALGAWLAAAVAHAAPGGTAIEVSHSGYLLDAADLPLTATVTLKARVFDAADAGTLEWEGTCPGVTVRGGYYAVVLGGAGCPGSAGAGDQLLSTTDVPAGAPRWLEIVVGSATLAPRVALASVPRAMNADLLGGQPPSAFAAASHAHATDDVTGFAAAAVAAASASGAFAPATHAHAQASGTQDGFLAASDWTSFTNKLSVESDPKIGALSAGKWCTSDGSKVVCTSDEPAPSNGGFATAAPCSASTIGHLWYDVSVPALKVCNGATYTQVNAVAGPPGPPATPSVAVGSTTLTVSWITVAGATSYEVGYEVGTTIGASPTVVPVPSGIVMPLEGLTNGTMYAVAVRTVAGSWTSAWSTVVQKAPAAITYATITNKTPPYNGSSSVTFANTTAGWLCTSFDPSIVNWFWDSTAGKSSGKWFYEAYFLSDTTIAAIFPSPATTGALFDGPTSFWMGNGYSKVRVLVDLDSAAVRFQSCDGTDRRTTALSAGTTYYPTVGAHLPSSSEGKVVANFGAHPWQCGGPPAGYSGWTKN